MRRRFRGNVVKHCALTALPRKRLDVNDVLECAAQDKPFLTRAATASAHGLPRLARAPVVEVSCPSESGPCRQPG